MVQQTTLSPFIPKEKYESYIKPMTKAVANLNYNEEQDYFTFRRRQYKVTSFIQVDNEVEINFMAVSPKTVKRYACVSFRDEEPYYDGFNEKPINKFASKRGRKPKYTPEEFVDREKAYQREYYLRRTKLRRAEARAMREKKPRQPRTYEHVCAICGKEFTDGSPRSRYCNEECRKIGKRETNREFLKEYKKTEAFKEALKKSYENRKEKLKNDEEYAQRYKEQQLRSIKKRKEKEDENS